MDINKKIEEDPKIKFLEMLIERLTNLEIKIEEMNKKFDSIINDKTQKICLKCINECEFHPNGLIKKYSVNVSIDEEDYYCACNKVLFVKKLN